METLIITDGNIEFPRCTSYMLIESTNTLDILLTTVESALISHPYIRLVVFVGGNLDVMVKAYELSQFTSNSEKLIETLVIPFIINLQRLESLCYQANAKLLVSELQPIPKFLQNLKNLGTERQYVLHRIYCETSRWILKFNAQVTRNPPNFFERLFRERKQGSGSLLRVIRVGKYVSTYKLVTNMQDLIVTHILKYIRKEFDIH